MFDLENDRGVFITRVVALLVSPWNDRCSSERLGKYHDVNDFHGLIRTIESRVHVLTGFVIDVALPIDDRLPGLLERESALSDDSHARPNMSMVTDVATGRIDALGHVEFVRRVSSGKRLIKHCAARKAAFIDPGVGDRKHTVAAIVTGTDFMSPTR